MNYNNNNKNNNNEQHGAPTDNPRVERMGAVTKKGYRIKKNIKKTGRLFGGVFGGVFKIIATVILVATIICCIVGTALTIYVMQYVRSAPEIDLNALKMNFNSSVYGKDDNGEYIQIQTLRYDMDRIWVDLKDIPKTVQDAFVYSEDERFYTHTGVDFVRTAAAAVNEVLIKLKVLPDSDRFGASTITQQLIKNINSDFDTRTYGVKVKEILMALNLEHHYSKDQILELYLNYVGLHAASGVQAASNYYFGKDVQDVNYIEAAALATITKNPSNLNPEYHAEENKERREIFALSKMLEFGTITQAEYDKAKTTELTIVGSSGVQNSDGTVNKSVQSYYVDALIEEVIDDLVAQYNYSRKYAEQLLYTSGYQIYSNMEISTQNTLERYFEDLTTFDTTQLGSKEAPEASMVICDLHGNVVALVGGIGEKTGARNFNRATMALRPAGSTIKPIAIYGPAMDQNLIHWSSILLDNYAELITDSNGNVRGYPRNYNWTYSGNMTMIHALKVSVNTIPYKLGELMTARSVFDFVHDDLGLQSLKDPDNVNLATLSMGDGGVYLDELTNAFQIFGNGGTFTESKLYSKVTDAEGKKIVLNAETRDTTRVLDSDTAYVMNKALWRTINEYGGSGRGAAIEGFETIGKTGTSNDRKDLLFVGVTPYYVAGIRYGYDDNNEVIPGAQSFQVPVWQEIMTAVHEGKNPADFQLNDTDTMPLTYCTGTGMVATHACTSTAGGYYRTNNLPATCYYHINTPTTPTPDENTDSDINTDTGTGNTPNDINPAPVPDPNIDTSIPDDAIVQE